VYLLPYHLVFLILTPCWVWLLALTAHVSLVLVYLVLDWVLLYFLYLVVVGHLVVSDWKMTMLLIFSCVLTLNEVLSSCLGFGFAFCFGIGAVVVLRSAKFDIPNASIFCILHYVSARSY
jgi:hypothetical protein